MKIQEKQTNEQNRLGITNIEELCYGQPRPYADHQYKWKLTLNKDVETAELLKFCQSFLRNNNNPYENWVKHCHDNICEYFKGYYSLNRVGNNQYVYHVMEPFAD